ncbi:MAG TPA: MCP four helix bundle domain-containing protein, partial [Burkholderiales bacterium]|nr:MCP four helix bundle domain-containing protein [Burkholderiales bacterium]
MTIGKRMGLLVLMALTGIVLMAGMGEYEIDKVFTAANYANVNTVPSYRVLFQIRKAFGDVRESSLHHVILTDGAAMAAMEKNIAAQRAELEEQLTRYSTNGCNGASCVSDDKEQKMLNDVKALIAAYDVERLKVLELSRANKTHEAMAAFESRVIPAIDKAQHAINVQLDYNTELAQKGADDGKVAQHSAIVMSVSVALLTLLGVGLMGFMITRGITRQMGGEPADAAEVANRVAAGDLSKDIALKPGDTTSLMASMSRMQAAIKDFTAAQARMKAQHDEGTISYRIDASPFAGSYRDMAEMTNELVASHIAVKMRIVDVVTRYAAGDLSVDMDRLPGEKARITQAIDGVKASLKAVNEQIAMLVEAASRGDFKVRGDAKAFDHEFRK